MKSWRSIEVHLTWLIGARRRLRRWPIAVGLAGLLGVTGFSAAAEPASQAIPVARGVPAYQGPLQDLADASVYIFDGKIVQLFGVIDPKPITFQHRAAVLKVVRQILDGRSLICYRHGDDIHYQCYVDGVDFAILLLQRGLVTSTSNTPSE